MYILKIVFLIYRIFCIRALNSTIKLSDRLTEISKYINNKHLVLHKHKAFFQYEVYTRIYIYFYIVTMVFYDFEAYMMETDSVHLKNSKVLLNPIKTLLNQRLMGFLCRTDGWYSHEAF